MICQRRIRRHLWMWHMGPGAYVKYCERCFKVRL